MSNQTALYKPGDRVWCNSMNWIWWPGRVVDLKDTPVEYQQFIIKKNKNKCVAIVFFEEDNTYEQVVNVNKIMSYNCENKMMFLQKGYDLYRKQLKGGHIAKYNIEMEKFIKEAEMAEKDTGGDEQIFKLLAEKYETVNAKVPNIKELFVSSKDKLKKQKLIAQSEVLNKSLQQSSSRNKRNKKDGQASNRNSNIKKQPQTSRNLNKTKEANAKKMKVLQAGLLNNKNKDSNDSSMDTDLISHKIIEAKTSHSPNRVFDFDDTIASLGNDENLENMNYKFLNNFKIDNKVSLSDTLIINNSSETPKSKNIDKHLMLNNLNSTDVQKKAENKQCVEDSTTIDDHLRIFKRDSSYIPNWVKEEKWDTMEGSCYNKAVQAWKTDLGKLPDLSQLKFTNALKPIMPMNAIGYLEQGIDDLEIDIEPNEPPPGYERRILLVPRVDEEERTEKFLSDEELLKSPFIQRVLKRIELGDTDGISVTIPNAKLLAKDE